MRLRSWQGAAGVLLSLVLAWPGVARAAELAVFVAVPDGLDADALTVAVDGGPALPLRDDGSVAHDTPGDRIFTAEATPRSGRTADLALFDGDAQLYAGPVRVDDARWSSVAFTLRAGPEGAIALRVPTAWPGGALLGDRSLPLVAAAAWGGLGVGMVGLWLLAGTRRRRRGARGGT